MSKLRRLPLENAYNVRELGGYIGENKRVTAYQQFLRGDDVSSLSEADIKYLVDYDVRAVIDLRSDYEVDYVPNVLSSISQINYVHVSLLPMDLGELDSLDDNDEMFNQFGEEILTKIYIDILTDATDGLRQIFEFIAKQTGGVLFHCAAGKDRTGVLAMLLLGLAGVERADIVANYMVTEVYNAENPNERVVNLPIKLPEGLMASKPGSIAGAYDFLMSTYGSFEDYFRAIGLRTETIQRIREKLLGKIDS